MTNPKFDRFHERLLNLLDEFNYMLDVRNGAIIVKDRSHPGLSIIGDFADDTVPPTTPNPNRRDGCTS